MQELKQISLIEAIGKTISDIRIGRDYHIIKYSDSTFSYFDFYEEWNIHNQNDNFTNYNYIIGAVYIDDNYNPQYPDFVKDLIELDILNECILLEDAKDYIELSKKRQKELEYSKYLKLKEKFENS